MGGHGAITPCGATGGGGAGATGGGGGGGVCTIVIVMWGGGACVTGAVVVTAGGGGGCRASISFVYLLRKGWRCQNVRLVQTLGFPT